MRAWRILLPLGSSHKLLAGPGLGARAAIFWAPIWGRLKLFNLGPHLWEGYNSGCLWAMRAFPLLRKRLPETAGAQFDSSFLHQVLMMCLPEFIHCLDSLTNYSRCMSNLFFCFLLFCFSSPPPPRNFHTWIKFCYWKWNFSTKMDSCPWKLKFQSIVDHSKIMYCCSSVQFGIV